MTMRRAQPIAQTTQTATDGPPAKAGAQASMASMAGVNADSNDVSARASSGGTHGASQSGTCKASIGPELPARTPAFATVHAAIE